MKYYKAEDVIRAIEEIRAIDIEVIEEDEIKFYYVDSIDEYWIGQRLDNLYYAKWNSKLGFIWSASRYLPWGEHVVDEQTLWKEHTYPSEPREIPFTEWIVGFMKKHTSEDAISREDAIRWVKTECNPYGKPTLDYDSGRKVIEHLKKMSIIHVESVEKPKEGECPQMDEEITKNSLRTDCNGCRFVGLYDTDFPCVSCVRKNKDYYTAEAD